MKSEDKWERLGALDDELLMGGVILSEWTTYLIREADEAFCAGANLAAILAAQAAMECHLRYELVTEGTQVKGGFFELIERSGLPGDLRSDLHRVRKYRNKWVHVNDPEADEELLARPLFIQSELEDMAWQAIQGMRRVIYFNQAT